MRRTGAARARALTLGLAGSITKVVPREWTIAHYNPKLPAVFSTPAMIGLMELAAARAVQPCLPHGSITVGTRIEVDHLKAIPAGARVRASARLAKIDGRFLVFDVEARSGREMIGRGRVFRAIVSPDQFAAKAARRARASGRSRR